LIDWLTVKRHINNAVISYNTWCNHFAETALLRFMAKRLIEIVCSLRLWLFWTQQTVATVYRRFRYHGQGTRVSDVVGLHHRPETVCQAWPALFISGAICFRYSAGVLARSADLHRQLRI
jgi:hypothetical protein